MRVLITGITGFLGRHLADCVLAARPEAELWGLVWAAEGDRRPVGDHVRIVRGDLTDVGSLTEVVETVRPNVVFHLAAASSVASSWSRPGRYFEVNTLGTVNLCEALRGLDEPPRIVVSTSAEIYGDVPADQQPIAETAPARPVSPYAASKAAQDLVCAQYHRGFALPLVRLRPFNQTGPGRPRQFVASSFAYQIARIDRGLDAPRLAVGNLDAIRDFTDVRDVAEAFWLAAEHGEPGAAYNVCSGHGISIRELLDHLLAMTSSEIDVQVDPAMLRTADLARLVGDNQRLVEVTGWRPKIPLEQTLADLLRWWRGQL